MRFPKDLKPAWKELKWTMIGKGDSHRRDQAFFFFTFFAEVRTATEKRIVSFVLLDILLTVRSTQSAYGLQIISLT